VKSQDFEGGQAEFVRWVATAKDWKRSKSSRGCAGSRGMSSVQWSRPGVEGGAATMRKFLAGVVDTDIEEAVAMVG